MTTWQSAFIAIGMTIITLIALSCDTPIIGKPIEWDMGNGVFCYTNKDAMSCVQFPAACYRVKSPVEIPPAKR